MSRSRWADTSVDGEQEKIWDEPAIVGLVRVASLFDRLRVTDKMSEAGVNLAIGRRRVAPLIQHLDASDILGGELCSCSTPKWRVNAWWTSTEDVRHNLSYERS